MMEIFSKRKKASVKRYVILALVLLTVMAGASAPYLMQRAGLWHSQTPDTALTDRLPDAYGRPAAPQELRGVWVAYLSLDGVDRAKIDEIMTTAKRNGMNTVYFHVRPFGDALYPSDYYPWSHLVTGTQGEAPADGFDPLAYAVEAAHREGLALHAWLNPLRIALNSGVYPPALSLDNPYTVWINDDSADNDDWVIDYKQGKYYNPAIPEVREQIIDGVREIVTHYNVDGIHWDDYFYPAPDASFDDSKAYHTYTAAGGKLSLLDWRTQNISTLVRDVHEAVKSIDPTCQFGISPSGNIENCLDMGADVVTWGSTEGYVDYLIPQIYWTNDNTVAPYEPMCRKWRGLVTSPSVKLYIGLALYKAGSDADSGKWLRADDIMRQQVLYARGEAIHADGFALYSYAYLEQEQTSAEMAHLREAM